MIGAPGHPLQLVLGPALWALGFVVMYGGHAIGCAALEFQTPPATFTTFRAVLFLIALVLAGLLSWLALRGWRHEPASGAARTERFIARITAGVHLAAAVSLPLIAAPLLVLPPCV